MKVRMVAQVRLGRRERGVHRRRLFDDVRRMRYIGLWRLLDHAG
jgi:hypothetical protein